MTYKTSIFQNAHIFILSIPDAREWTTPHKRPVCSRVILPQIDEETACDIVNKWLGSDQISFVQSEKIRFGKTIMVYYPFWCYRRKDGGEDKTICRPACGTLLTGLQNMKYYRDAEIIETPKNAIILPVTVDSSVCLPELHRIARGEELNGLPLWLISYKMKRNIYMTGVEAYSGVIFPEWNQ
jgi:hypothetical protein